MSEAAYAVGQFRDPEAEMDRLRRQATVIAAAEDAAFVALGLPGRGRVLDVGCGPGFVAARLLAARPGLEVLGVDRDPQVLAKAAERIAVARADAASLPFRESSFDFAYSRLVLRHLRDPEAVVRGIHRVLVPGGRIVVVDTDDGTLVMDPWPPGFAEVLAARQETFRRRGADPFVGRKLPGMMVRAGFEDVRVEPLTLTTTAMGADVFVSIVLAPIADAIDPDLLAPAEVARAAEGLRVWARGPGAFAMTTVVCAGGARRAGR